MSFTIAWVDGQSADEVRFGQEMLPEGVTLIADPDGAANAPTRWAALVADADALVTKSAPVGEFELLAAPRVQLVQKYGGREDGIDLDAAASAGVAVATMPLRGCIAVAECAMALMLALSKQLVKGHAATVTGAYRQLGLEPELTSQQKHAFQWMKLTGLFELAGKSLGIVGFGEIGTEIAKRAHAFEMTVAYTKRTRLPRAIEARLDVSYKSLDELLADSDVIVVAAPHTPQTDRIIGANQLAMMGPKAVLVNISRGGLVDEAALVEALREKRIGGAGIDVYAEEPVPFDHPLLSCDNVTLTPHIGGGSGGAREKQLRDVLDNILRVRAGAKPSHVVEGVPTRA